MTDDLTGPGGPVSTDTDALVAFFCARLDEDEQEAREALAKTTTSRRMIGGQMVTVPVTPPAWRTAVWPASRVLREVEAKRRLIQRYENAVAAHTSIASFTRGQDDGYRQACLDAIRDAAEIYADHPDYHAIRRRLVDLQGVAAVSDRVTVIVLLVADGIGDEPDMAHVAIRGTSASAVVPAARIAADSGTPVNELPGREFSAEFAGEGDNELSGFRLLNDPRE